MSQTNLAVLIYEVVQKIFNTVSVDNNVFHNSLMILIG
jgi:hypothetical protein